MTTQPMDPDNPPAWAVEGVRLNAYDPRWPDCAARYADELEPVLNQWLLGRNWRYVPPELDGRPWRRFFAKVSPDGRHRLAHLHLMSAGATRWDQQIRFRDALRASPALRDEYAAIKSRLASTYAGDRERYTDEKAAL